MAMTRAQLKAGLEARGQYYLINILELYDNAFFDGTLCADGLNDIDAFIDGLIATQQHDQLDGANIYLANNLIIPQPDNDTPLNNAAWRNLKISLMIAKAFKDLGYIPALQELLKWLVNGMILGIAVNRIADVNQVGLANNISQVVKNIVLAIGGLAVNPADNVFCTQLTVQNDAADWRLFENANIGNLIANLNQGGFVDNKANVLVKAKIFPLINAVELTPNLEDFTQLLKQKAQFISLRHGTNTLNSFRNALFDALVDSNVTINNSYEAFTGAMNEVLHLRDPNRFSATDPAFRAAVDQLKTNANFFTQGQRRYLEFISKPQIYNCSLLKAKFKERRFKNALISYWRDNNLPDEARLNDFARAIREGFANPIGARQAFSNLLFGAAGGFELATAQAPFNVPNMGGALAIVADLNLADGAAVDASIANLTTEANHNNTRNRLFKAVPALSDALSEVYSRITTADAANAVLGTIRHSLSVPNINWPTKINTFFNAIANEPLIGANPAPNVASVRTHLATLLSNAPHNIDVATFNAPTVTDAQAVELIGEARLRMELGVNFGELFGQDNRFALAEYKKLCHQVGVVAPNEWRVILNRYIDRVINEARDATHDSNTAIIGFLRLYKVYGYDFIQYFPATKIKEAAQKVGAWTAETLVNERNDWYKKLAEFADKVVNKNAAGFRAEIASPTATYKLLDAVTEAEFDSPSVNTEIMLLRLEKVLGADIVKIIRKNDNGSGHLFNLIINEVKHSSIWESTLRGLLEDIKGCAKTGNIKLLAEKLENHLHYINNFEFDRDPQQNKALRQQFIHALPSMAGNIIADYRLLKLTQALKEQGLDEIAIRLEHISVNHQLLKNYLSKHNLPDNLHEKIDKLKLVLATSQTVRDLELGLSDFLTEIIDNVAKPQILGNLLTVINAANNEQNVPTKKILIDGQFERFITQLSKLVGIEFANNVRAVEHLVKQQMENSIVIDGLGNITGLQEFQVNKVAVKANVLRATLNAVPPISNANQRVAIQNFLNDFVPAGKQVTASAEISPDAVCPAIREGAQRATFTAAIEDPFVAQWLANYKKPDGNSLILNHNHIVALNMMFQRLAADLDNIRDPKEKRQLIIAEIKRLVAEEKLPEDFPVTLFVKANNEKDTEDRIDYWLNNLLPKLNVLRAIEHPVLRWYVLNDTNLLKNTIANLKENVEAINQNLRAMPAAVFAIRGDYARQIFQPVPPPARTARLFINFFANNRAAEQACEEDYARVRAIQADVPNPELKKSLIDDPRAFKGNVARINAFGANLDANITNDPTIYEAYLADPLNRLPREEFAELYTEQTHKKCYEALGLQDNFRVYGNYDADKRGLNLVLERFMGGADAASGDRKAYENQLKHAKELLVKFDPEGFFKHDSEINIKNADLFKQKLENLQYQLIIVRDKLKTNLAYYKDMLSRLEAIENETALPLAFFTNLAVERTPDFLQNVVALKRKLQAAIDANIDLTGKYNEAINKVTDNVLRIEKRTNNAEKVLDSTARAGKEGFTKTEVNLSKSQRFYVDWVKPSDGIITTFVTGLHKNKSGAEDKVENVPMNLAMPEGAEGSTLTLTSPGAKSVLTKDKNDDHMFRILRLPSKDTDKTRPLAKTNPAEFQVFAKAYAGGAKIPKSFINSYGRLTDEQRNEVKKVAALLFECNTSGEITITNVHDRNDENDTSLGAALMLELLILNEIHKTNIKVYDGSGHGCDMERLRNAAKGVYKHRLETREIVQPEDLTQQANNVLQNLRRLGGP